MPSNYRKADNAFQRYQLKFMRKEWHAAAESFLILVTLPAILVFACYIALSTAVNHEFLLSYSVASLALTACWIARKHFRNEPLKLREALRIVLSLVKKGF